MILSIDGLVCMELNKNFKNVAEYDKDISFSRIDCSDYFELLAKDKRIKEI